MDVCWLNIDMKMVKFLQAESWCLPYLWGKFRRRTFKDVLLSLPCSARARHCIRLSVGLVHDWYASRLVRLICCQIIFTACSPGSLLICRSPAIRLLVLSPFPLGRVRSAVSCYTWTRMVAPSTDLFGMFPLFLRKLLIFRPQFVCVFRWLVRLCSFPYCWRQANITPIPKVPPPSSFANYRPKSITSVLSKGF